ncbi:MAG: hypothetical protein FJ271_28310 [Planctomycetes bacterium]|nr:hypothetical protein [Planctomycetota bacterium]
MTQRQRHSAGSGVTVPARGRRAGRSVRSSLAALGADRFSPDRFSPDRFSPDRFSPDRFSNTPAACRHELLVGDALDADDVLLAFLGENAGEGAVLAFRANVAVVLLVARLVEEVDHVLLVLLHDEDGGALREPLEHEVALGAGDLALERLLLALLVLGRAARTHDQSNGNNDSKRGHQSLHGSPS